MGRALLRKPCDDRSALATRSFRTVRKFGTSGQLWERWDAGIME